MRAGHVARIEPLLGGEGEQHLFVGKQEGEDARTKPAPPRRLAQAGGGEPGLGEESHQTLPVGSDEGEGGNRHLLRRLTLGLEAPWLVLNGHLRFRKDWGLAVGRIPARSPPAAKGAEDRAGPGDTMTKTVMIVEDNELNMKLFHDLLEAHGYRTVETRSGVEAVELARANRPDLIIMDIQLPEISGLDVTRKLKADPELRAIPVVAVTAFAMKGDEERIRAGGCEAYLSKPISVARFLETVRQYTGG